MNFISIFHKTVLIAPGPQRSSLLAGRVGFKVSQNPYGWGHDSTKSLNIIYNPSVVRN